MDTKDLLSFLKIYELKSISKAAQELYISPQGLSKVLIKLENELEVNLFTRDYTGVEPTPYGERLAKRAEQVIAKLDSIKSDVLDYENKTPLNIASTYGVMAYLSIDFIKDFKKNHPNINLNITEYPDKPLEKLLIDEAVDLAFLTGPIDTTNFESTFFTTHQHCLVIHENHRLARKEYINYSDLNNEPLILMGQEFRDYHNNINRFLKAGVSPNIVLGTSEINLTHELASQNKAIGLSVDFPAFRNSHFNTVIKPFSDQSCTWDTYIAFKKEKAPKKEALTFYDFSLKWIQENRHKLFHWDTGI